MLSNNVENAASVVSKSLNEAMIPVLQIWAAFWYKANELFAVAVSQKQSVISENE